jgi:2-polyprenyl-6-methoxyphenol hydroxylase-like FAD-dependent oxidoreductase
MHISETHTQVLIVGAGPSGLMLAAQLLRYGVIPIIIDSKQGPTNQSKALAVQARSLEIYRQMGVIDRVIENGKKAGSIALTVNGNKAAELSLADVGDGETAFPFVHLYQQNKNERLLLDFLTLHCCPVYWETDLTAIKQSSATVEATLQFNNQNTTLTCDWVAGADGAHSSVRKQLQIPFNGETYSHNFYLADVELADQKLDNNQLQFFLGKTSFAAFFPLPEENRFRIIGNLPDGFDSKGDLKAADMLPVLEEVTQQRIAIANDYWTTAYRLHHRMAARFREGRCFLVGDAAHIHSPVGGQGMNTGLQDAYNLAWKLAGVVNKQLAGQILDSYADERMPVAKQLLSTTDRFFKVIMSRNWLMGLVKSWMVPPAIKFAWAKKAIRKQLFQMVSQIGISYRNSNINLHLSQSGKIKAGDRLPYLKVFDEKKQQETDLHEWCGKPGFTFIVLGKLTELDLFTLAKWITQSYHGFLNFFYLPPSPKNHRIFEIFEIRENQQKALIIRPDMYIGLISDAVDITLMDNYLRNVVGVS